MQEEHAGPPREIGRRKTNACPTSDEDSPRHVLHRIDRRSRASDDNTPFLPGYEEVVEEDRVAISAGAAERDGNTYHINDRSYVEKGGTGGYFPIGGEGTVTIDRATYRCLVLFATYNGPGRAALTEIEHDPLIGDDQLEQALALWSLRS